MKDTYFWLEICGLIVLIILLYANIFESKIRSAKRTAFIGFICSNIIMLAADAVTCANIDWVSHGLLLHAATTITYVLPFISLGLFGTYLILKHDNNSKTNKYAFLALLGYSSLSGIITLILCLASQIFRVVEGALVYNDYLKYGYYGFYVFALILLAAVIIIDSKRLKIHDTIVAVLYCLIPAIFMILVSTLKQSGSLVVVSIPFVILFIHVCLQSESEVKLINNSNIDSLTGLLNRRAYEEDLGDVNAVPVAHNFAYASIDVNGLKQVNDTLGHAAGDELICGAAHCLKCAFSSYGKVYRTGGDEFAVIFYSDPSHLKKIKQDLDDLTLEWKGQLVNSIALSIGIVTKKECPKDTIDQLSIIADKRMYEDKVAYYGKKGVDRREQNEAYKVLCGLYTKILKIDITNDSFKIISMIIDEKTEDKGFSYKISEWFMGFANSGNIHPDDVDNFRKLTDINHLRSYFRSGKTSLTFSYRRKYINKDSFKQVVMELIPSSDYTETEQQLYLYVKDIDL